MGRPAGKAIRRSLGPAGEPVLTTAPPPTNHPALQHRWLPRRDCGADQPSRRAPL